MNTKSGSGWSKQELVWDIGWLCFYKYTDADSMYFMLVTVGSGYPFKISIDEARTLAQVLLQHVPAK